MMPKAFDAMRELLDVNLLLPSLEPTHLHHATATATAAATATAT